MFCLWAPVIRAEIGNLPSSCAIKTGGHLYTAYWWNQTSRITAFAHKHAVVHQGECRDFRGIQRNLNITLSIK